MSETINMLTPPMTAAEAQVYAPTETLIGFRAITEAGPICTEGCLAPGSSAHSHSVITGYLIVHSQTLTYLNADLMATRQSMLHPFPDSEV